MSHATLEEIARLKVHYRDRVHFLLGNHELAELTDYPIQKNRQMLNLLFRMGLEQMYGDESERVRDALVGFLWTSPLAVRIAHGVFVCHSIPEGVDRRPFDRTIFERPVDPLEFYERGDLFQMVWGRDHRPENARAFAELMEADVVINGHEPCAGRLRGSQSAPGDRRLLRGPGVLHRAAGRPPLDAGGSGRKGPAAGVAQ